MPIETACSHYSCADCLTQVLELSDGPPFCPICKTNLTCETDLRKASKVFVQLLYQQGVRCKTCKRELQYQQCSNHVCDAPAQPEVAVNSTQPAPPQNPQPIAPASQRTIEDAFTELQQGKLSKDVARLSTAAVKLLMKESTDGGTAKLVGPGKVIFCHYVHFFF